MMMPDEFLTVLAKGLFIGGLIFPVVSWLSAIASVVTRWRTKRWASPVFVPIIGPVLLTTWILVEKHSLWTIPAVWVLDIGTVAFAVVLPRLIKQWWEISRYTRIMTLRGASGIQNSVLTLHSTGRYFLQKTWTRPKGEIGILGLGEVGTFLSDGDAFQLIADHGLRRRLVRTDDQSFFVDEHTETRPGLSEDYSLHDWVLTLCSNP